MNRPRRIAALLFALASVFSKLVAAESPLNQVLQLNAAARGSTAAFEQLSALRLLDNAGGADAWEVGASFPGGFEQRLFIDRATHRVTRRSETSAPHPNLNARQSAQHTGVLKWLEVDGMRFLQSMRKYESETGALTQESEVLAAEVFRACEPLPAALQTTNFIAP